MAVELGTDDIGISIGAIILYTDRVMAALVSLAPEWIYWSSYLERLRHGLRISAEGFSYCVGFIDGTTLSLYQKSARYRMAYYNWKKIQCNFALVLPVDYYQFYYSRTPCKYCIGIRSMSRLSAISIAGS